MAAAAVKTRALWDRPCLVANWCLVPGVWRRAAVEPAAREAKLEPFEAACCAAASSWCWRRPCILLW